MPAPSAAYLKVHLGGQNFTKKLARADTQGVSEEPDFLDIRRAQLSDVGFKIRSIVELETLSLEGEHLARGGHDEYF